MFIDFAGSNKRLKNRDHSIDKIYVSLQIIIGKNHIFGAHPPLDATIEIHENKRDFGLRMDLQLTLSEKEQNLFAIFRIDFYPSDLQTDVTPGSYKLVYKK